MEYGKHHLGMEEQTREVTKVYYPRHTSDYSLIEIGCSPRYRSTFVAEINVLEERENNDPNVRR